MSGEFLGTTIGLDVVPNRGKGGPELRRVEFYRAKSGGVLLVMVSGRSLGTVGIAREVTQAQFDNRPRHNIEEARWAFELLGYSVCGS